LYYHNNTFILFICQVFFCKIKKDNRGRPFFDFIFERDARRNMHSANFSEIKAKPCKNTYYFLPITSYFPKNPECTLGKSEEVRGNK